MLLEITTLSF